jgi:hypothetical protein
LSSFCKELLEFLDRASIEPHLFWKIPHILNPKILFDIQWAQGKESKSSFYYKTSDEDAWKEVNAQQLLSSLLKDGADLEYFETMVKKVILTQSILAHYYIEKAGNLVGPQNIQSAIDMISQVAKNMKNSKAQHLSVVKDPG